MVKWSDDKLRALSLAATKGDVKAQQYLGWAYFEAKYVNRNDSDARKWLSLAADNGSKEAKYRLALVLINVRDGGAVKILEELANIGYSPAMYELGGCYFTGLLTDRDVNKSEALWTKAYAQGHVLAGIKLCKLNLSGPDGKWRPCVVLDLLRLSIVAGYFVAVKHNDERILGSIE